MQASSFTHMGLLRSNNEDRVLVKQFADDSTLIVVADGMGGHAAGDLAAQMTINIFGSFDPGENGNPMLQLQELAGAAQGAIVEASFREMGLFGMGTTLTAAYIRNKDAFWVHVGDTRLYLFRKGRLLRVTSDHTIPGVLLKRGEIGYEQARLHPMRNMLIRCLGCAEFDADSGTLNLEEGDLLLISTDGLHDLVPEEAIASALESGKYLESKLDRLVQAALTAGGTDNITVAAVLL
jgi:protein phosphatase